MVCLSNVRQIAFGLVLYSQDFDGYLPAAQDINNITFHLAIWQNVFRQPFPGGDPTGGGNYGYLKGTTFQCPRVGDGIDGLSTTDYRNNGYAMNISMRGTGGNLAWTNPFQTLRVQQYQRISLIRNGSATLLLTDATGFYVEYYNRGWTINEMDAGFSAGGGMWTAVRHGGAKPNAWNMAMVDGSASTMQFSQVPGAPAASFYNVGGQLPPGIFYAQTNVDSTAKQFWTGVSN